MLTPHDILDIKREAHDARMPYRETLLVFPTVTSGSNYEPFTDSPYEITGAESGQVTTTFMSYRAYTRVKIIQDTTLLKIYQAVPGLEVGDYLLYFRDNDKGMVDKLVTNEYAYLVVDNLTFRVFNTTLNGVGKTFDVYVHAKKASPRYRMTGT